MGMDKNTMIGFVLIGVLLIGMFMMNSKNRLAYEGEQKRISDSITALKPIADTAALRRDSVLAASLRNKQLPQVMQGNQLQETAVLENDVLKITFTNKGGQPAEVTLKNYKKYDGSLVTLETGSYNKLGYTFNSGNNQTLQSSDVLFKVLPVTVNADKSQTLTFKTADSTGKEITHQYNLKQGSYLVDFTIGFKGATNLFTQNAMTLNWLSQTEQIEKDFKYELTQTQVGYVKDGSFDFNHAGKGDKESFSKPVDWVAVKQQFFIAALLAKNKFTSTNITWKVPTDSSKYLMQTETNAQLAIAGGDNVSVPLQLYYGPSDYNILKQYGNGMQDMVPYGSGIFSFVKYINRHVLLPVFDFIQRNVASMGIVILLLTLFIRLITSPILYKSYLSGAKMKVLKPEVDALKEKFKNPKTGELDQQAFSMEQMKLWRTAGVSPLGGCLPAVLQIPIFMSLYYFFQSNIDLRGKNFLWANDLSTYDTIAKLPFEIPFYGDHVSLFTLTAVITSLVISLYSMSNMQDNSNPVMKYMPYIFPILLLGVFNRLPAALTWYYTVSNTITLILQVIIQKYIIDHDKILAQINENKKKPKKKSKLAERMEMMQQAQKKMQNERLGNGKKA